MKKKAFALPSFPDTTSLFSWGLRVSDFDSLYLVSGLADQDHPGDPVAQTETVLAQLGEMVTLGGFSLDDIIRMEWTFRSDVNDSDFARIRDLWAAFLEPTLVKPAGGTLRYVERLANPMIMVEYELLLAATQSQRDAHP